MKTSILVLASLVASVMPLLADKAGQEKLPPPTAYQVAANGLDHRVWQRNVYERAPDGRIVTRVRQYTELATGMNYLDANGQMFESQEVIEEYATGAIAQKGQYKVIFANNLNTYGSIDMQTPDGKRLQSNIIGLSYYDCSTGRTALIAQLQDSSGQLVADNRVLYVNAFAGVKADVRYTYKKGGFEQDVILREQLPTPESYGLRSETSELMVMTEFLNPPEAQITTHSGANGNSDDQDVSWGVARLGHGKAFDLQDQRGPHSLVRVNRQYEVVNGRQVLFERVPVKNLSAKLAKLPLHSGISKPKSPLKMAAKEWHLPATPQARAERKPIKLASTRYDEKGFVLDYIVVNANQNNFTFQGDATYHISAECNFTGTTTFESGTVIKHDGSGQIDIDSGGTIVCNTGPYRPAIFTSINDDSIGEVISGSSASPASGDVYCFLSIDATPISIHDLRFSYCWVGALHVPGSALIDITDCQFNQVDSAVWGNNAALHNVLIKDSMNVDGGLYLWGNSLVGENVTADGGPSFVYFDGYVATTLALTNCLITGQIMVDGNWTSLAVHTNFTVCLASPSVPVYQTVGAGSYYLTNNSPYRQVGTTNISSALRSDLAKKSTYPPMVYSVIDITNVTIFNPQAGRDSNNTNLDLGYHYDALDYAFDSVTAYTNLIFTAGTAVALFSPYGGWTPWGLGLMNDVTVTFAGTATAPCYSVQYSTVQEDGNAVWMENSHAEIDPIEGYDPARHPSIDAIFTVFSHPHWGQHFSDGGGVNLLNARAKNSEFYGQFGGYNLECWFTNCLFFRVNYWQGTSDSQYGFENYRDVIDNCTFYGGTWEFAHWEDPPDWLVSIRNCAFDGVALNLYDASDGFGWLTSDYNATNNCTYGGYDLPGSHNVHPSGSYNWQTSWFGNFYLPSGSALINAGSTTADNVGLYHFTTRTDQTKETNSTVDIGYHYVATDAYGNPLDSNGDGVPDAQEDDNGNGTMDNGELDWKPWPALDVLITRPRNGSTLP